MQLLTSDEPRRGHGALESPVEADLFPGQRRRRRVPGRREVPPRAGERWVSCWVAAGEEKCGIAQRHWGNEVIHKPLLHSSAGLWFLQRLVSNLNHDQNLKIHNHVKDHRPVRVCVIFYNC